MTRRGHVAMATELRRRTPLGALTDELAAVCAGEGFRCHEDAFRTLTEIRCAGGGEAEARGAVAAELPPLLRMTVDGDRSVVSLGPNWWLVDAPDGSRPVAGSELVSAVDISAQRTPLVLAGPQAR